jgi:glucose-6-phosphate isomerase
MARSRSSDRAAIRFSFDNLLAARIGGDHGFQNEDLARLREEIPKIHARIDSERREGKLPFLDLPYQPTAPIKRLAREIRSRFENFVLLGIGGSALGPIALHQALCPPFYNLLPPSVRDGPRMFFLDNVDPTEIAAVLDLIDLKKTAINVVTKSGSTTETLAQFLLFKDRLERRVGRRRAAEQIIATTDPEAGPLRRIAKREGYRTQPIPPGVGGRFSVLTAVGLLPAAVAGIAIDRLLAGAAVIDRLSHELPPSDHPAYLAALLLVQAQLKFRRNVLVLMPYAEGLVGMAQWFCQLWAESLGKARREDRTGNPFGQLPTVAVGATDQHSQLQLYMEGPIDRTIQFWRVDAFLKEITLPGAGLALDLPLKGRKMGKLLNLEGTATERSLAEAGRPSCRIDLPALDAHTVGQLIYLLELQTAFAGRLLRINPFDQPGVESGKRILRSLLAEKKTDR